MAYQMTLTLTEQEYATLTAEAAKNGKQPETLLHDMIQHLQPSLPAKRRLTEDEFVQRLYREGKITIPTRRPWTQEEKAGRERLAQVFAGGKPASEIINEGRGSY